MNDDDKFKVILKINSIESRTLSVDQSGRPHIRELTVAEIKRLNKLRADLENDRANGTE